MAVKRLIAGAPDDALRALQREIDLLKRASANCAHVVKYYGTCNKDGRLCLVMKRYERSLADKLRAAPGRRLPEAEALVMAIQLFTGLAELRELSIISRDIKPRYRRKKKEWGRREMQKEGRWKSAIERKESKLTVKEELAHHVDKNKDKKKKRKKRKKGEIRGRRGRER